MDYRVSIGDNLDIRFYAEFQVALHIWEALFCKFPLSIVELWTTDDNGNDILVRA